MDRVTKGVRGEERIVLGVVWMTFSKMAGSVCPACVKWMPVFGGEG